MQAPSPLADASVAGPEERVIAALMSIGRLMKVRLGDGIDPGTHHLLHTLRCAGAVRVTDLATLCRLDTSTVSRHVAALERNGLVARSPHPDDGRAMAVGLTDEGRIALEHAMQTRKELLVGLLADWPRDEITTLARLLTVFAADADAMTTELSAEPAPKVGSTPKHLRSSTDRSTETSVAADPEPTTTSAELEHP